MEDATFLSKPRKKIRILIISEPATNISGGIYIELSRGKNPLMSHYGKTFQIPFI